VPAPAPDAVTPDDSPRPLGRFVAGALVFGSSAAVLVVELVALRLLAPYLGLTLETSTFVIGTALAAIALGSWAGGHAADTMPPRRMLAPLLAVSGVAVAFTPFLVRSAGADDGGGVLLVALLTLLVPGAALSAVTPTVTKLVLTDLHETGTVVGRLSGIGTAGAIAGTVITGFVLITHVPVSGILVGLGALLVVAAVVVEVWVRRSRLGRGTTAAVALVALGGLTAVVAPGGCDVETTYHCAVVQADPARESGRTLVLDGLRHSYVDLADPSYLEFSYVRAIASVAATQLAPAPEPVRAYHLGGGGLTFPRYLHQQRPGTDNVVSEIDPGVVQVDEQRLGLDPGDGVTVRVEDGRRGLARLAADSRDLVVGDAFGGVSVPWHLTTREAIGEIERVLTGDGVYAMNLIDQGELGFARAALATLQDTFDHVALTAPPWTLDKVSGGNMVAVASDDPLDLEALGRELGRQGTDWSAISGAELDRWVDGAEVLTDDHAPVDQLLTTSF
jgi:spermidine synthase